MQTAQVHKQSSPVGGIGKEKEEVEDLRRRTVVLEGGKEKEAGA